VRLHSLHQMIKAGFYLKRGSDILTSKLYPPRVRIWVISTVTAPNKHKSCKSCSSRTRPSVTAKMIVWGCWLCFDELRTIVESPFFRF